MPVVATGPQLILDEAALTGVDWSFTEVGPPPHPIHGLHPYPAKFVPALPRELIAGLSRPGDLVVDPFCGSGTALVEALLMGRQAAGSDLNPVAVLMSRAKTRRLDRRQLAQLARFCAGIETSVQQALATPSEVQLPAGWKPTAGQRFRGLKFWFDEAVAYELSALRDLCAEVEDPDRRDVCMMCFSAIIVTVSLQDSDTRYVRRQKNVRPGDVVRLFRRKLERAIEALDDLARHIEVPAAIHYQDARNLDYLESKSVSLVVTSPPYPNAWSYHLYHQNRILWLDADPWEFKAREIGHHRTYSAAKGRDESDFKQDMLETLTALRPALRADARVIVVVGDSIVRGSIVRNDLLLGEAAEEAGLRPVARFDRPINLRRKAFNPAIGKIKSEHVLVFRA